MEEKKIDPYSQLCEQILEAYGEKELYNVLAKMLGYEQAPPTIQEFIDSSDWLKDSLPYIYPPWRKALYEIFPNPFHSPYSEVVFTGAIGTGKSLIATIGGLYDVARVCMLDNPHGKFGTGPAKKIAFAIMSATLTLAGNVVFDQMTDMIHTSPRFRMFLNTSRYKRSLFKKNVDLFVGSRPSHALGMDVIGAILDEINFQNKVKAQAYKNYMSVKRRVESRFLRAGGYFARMWLVSSKTNEEGFLEQHIIKMRDNTNTQVYDYPLWELLKHKVDEQGRSPYCGKTFKVFVGDDHRDPRIIERPSDAYGLDEARIIDVPVEHYNSFKYDIFSALREMAGHSIGSVHTFIPSKQLIAKATKLPNPVKREIIVLDFHDPTDILLDYLEKNKLSLPQFQYTPRYLHFDMSLGKMDRLGVASSFVSEVLPIKLRDASTGKIITVNEPFFMTEFAFTIEAKKGSEIPIYKLKNFIRDLSNLGYPLTKITMDGFQSDNLRQDLILMGYTAEKLSADLTKDPYEKLKESILQKRWLGPKYTILYDELKDLLDVGKKIDHPPNGSKDCADAVACSVYSAYTAYKQFPIIQSIVQEEYGQLEYFDNSTLAIGFNG